MEVEHRNYVANGAKFSTGAAVFQLLLNEGLEQHHTLCDVGCGSLRVGRFLIMYLEPGCYCGIEPNSSILDAGIQYEVTSSLCNLKRAKFHGTNNYSWWNGKKFDWVLISGVLVHKSHIEIERALHAACAMLVSGGSCIVDYYPSSPHWTSDENPPYPQIAPHDKECLLVNPELVPTSLDKELFGSHYIRLVKQT